MKLHSLSLWSTVIKNHGRRSLTDKSRLGRKDAVQKSKMQNRHVTYREIEATLNINSTSIYKILGDQLAMKHDPRKSQKCEQMLKKYNGCASKDVYIVTGDYEWFIYVY